MMTEVAFSSSFECFGNNYTKVKLPLPLCDIR